MLSCSSIQDLDISKIIDNTENWLFNEEEKSNDKEAKSKEYSDEQSVEDSMQDEEIFPDINDVPQIKPDFEQIDESFFESEEEEIDNIDIDTNIAVGQVNQKESIKSDNV